MTRSVYLQRRYPGMELGLPEEARDHYNAFLALAPLRVGELRADAEQRLRKPQ